MASDPQGPTVRRRRLGSELRRLRDSKGLILEEVAKVLECSTSKISRIETGQGLLKGLELTALLDLYDVDDPEARRQITEIHRRASESGWWEQDEYDAVLPSGLSVYIGLEYDARALQAWQLGFVPGLLQTEAYARAVVSDSQPNAEDVRRLVEVRERRQERLTAGSDPLELWAVMDEAALLRPIGGETVMHDQLLRLIELSELPNVTLQVYPLDKGMHPGLRGTFSILEFGPSDPRIAYVDSPAGNLFIEKDRPVRALVHTLDQLRARALDPTETTARLHRAVKEKSS